MTSMYIIKRRFFGANAIQKSNPDVIVTSTPIKKTVCNELEMEWLSPMPKSLPESHTDNKLVPALNDIDVEPKIKEVKQLVIMDSDEEEEFWKNRNLPLKKGNYDIKTRNKQSDQTPPSYEREKRQEQTEALNPPSIAQQTVANDTEDKNRAIQPDKALKNSKDLLKNGSAEDSDVNRAKQAKIAVKSAKDLSGNEFAEYCEGKQSEKPARNSKELLTEASAKDSDKHNLKRARHAPKISKDSPKDELVKDSVDQKGKRPRKASQIPKRLLQNESVKDSDNKKAKRSRKASQISKELPTEELAKDSGTDTTAKQAKSASKIPKDLLQNEPVKDSNEKKTKLPQTASQISEESRPNELVADPNERELINQLQNAGVERTSENNENTVRRSTRKRCRPLEFWNGERMEIARDFTSGIENPKIYPKREKGETVECEEAKQSDQASKNISNSPREYKGEINLSKKSKIKKNKKSILKSKTNTKPKVNVKFSTIGSGTTIDGPTSTKNIRPHWVMNFAEINSSKSLLTQSESCVVLPGLNTAKETVSSALMQMRPNFINHNRAPDLHHLIFCVMNGTVSVKIDETTVRMERYGHFAVPCGVSYCIENIGKKNAILSLFEIACSCYSK